MEYFRSLPLGQNCSRRACDSKHMLYPLVHHTAIDGVHTKLRSHVNASFLYPLWQEIRDWTHQNPITGSSRLILRPKTVVLANSTLSPSNSARRMTTSISEFANGIRGFSLLRYRIDKPSPIVVICTTSFSRKIQQVHANNPTLLSHSSGTLRTGRRFRPICRSG